MSVRVIYRACTPRILSCCRRSYCSKHFDWNIPQFSCRNAFPANFILPVTSCCRGVAVHTQVTDLASEKVVRELDEMTYEKLSNGTLDELAEFFESLGDSGWLAEEYDVSLAAGVLTIQVGGGHGTYVINKHSVNKQIWLSSPTSGPKRFDIIDGRWRYSHTGEAFYDLLQQEFTSILGIDIDLSHLKHAHILSDAENWTN